MKKRIYSAEQLKMLALLSHEYPTIQSVSSAIINYNATANLPKGTEHFLSDLHGEAEAFDHIMNNCSGVIREKVDGLFYRSMSENERRELCTLIYYPNEKLAELREEGSDTEEWYSITLYRLVDLARAVASKYTRAKVRGALPDDFQYIIDELLHTSGEEHNKQEYYRHIISTIIDIGQGAAFIEALCGLVKRMAVDCLHVVGDIYDRGPRADKILDMLRVHHNVDIQWGNHDIVWMGAAAGSQACIAAVLNTAIQYNTLSIIENTYGISLRDLIGYAQETYKGCTWFMPRNGDDKYYIKSNMDNLSKAHKAIAIILFKLEGQLIERHPEYEMDDRRLLHRIDYDAHTVEIGGKVYPLNDYHFPTIDRNDPYALSHEERSLMDSLVSAFRQSRVLQKHIAFMYSVGGIYKIHNNNLLYHGCVPMTEDGALAEVDVFGKGKLSGRAYMDACDRRARRAFYEKDENSLDFMYYLWCGRKSPLFGKDKMTTFERYFVADKNTWKENRDPYYGCVDDFDAMCRILEEFGLDRNSSHIINGHIPVVSGENPIKANGRYILIDGGFCKAYHNKTGIAGYTLIYSSRGLRLVSHGQFDGKEVALKENKDIIAAKDVVFETMAKRRLVSDTDEGKEILAHMEDLKMLLEAYLEGTVKQAGQY